MLTLYINRRSVYTLYRYGNLTVFAFDNGRIDVSYNDFGRGFITQQENEEINRELWVK